MDPKEYDRLMSEAWSLEPLAAETPARTLAGVKAQLGMMLLGLTVSGGLNEEDETQSLENAIATLDRLAMSHRCRRLTVGRLQRVALFT